MTKKAHPEFKIKIKNGKISSSLMGIIAGISIGFGYEEYYGAGTWHSFETPTESISVCFTPPHGCGSLIAKNIIDARKSIFIQAYGFSNFAIINQLKLASLRGVKVRIILDGSNFSENKTIVGELRDVGIEVVRDSISGIAHNKIIIIDDYKVLTGSFNFTEAADKRNAENAVLIQDKEVARQYLENWNARYDLSVKS